MQLKTKAQLSAILGLLLPTLAAAETVLGIFVFHRHGDRTAKSTPPTKLTALGADQMHSSGEYYRSLYVASNATSRIAGISSDVAVNSQLNVVSPIDVVLQNSGQAFLQGLYPPTTADIQTLADGRTVQSTLGGYQYIPVNSLTTAATPSGAENDAWLQSGSGCAKAVASSNSYFASRDYLDTLESTRDFYQSLMPAINRTFKSDAANFKNGYAIYDLINVAQIHNASYQGRNLMTDAVLHQLYTRASQLEWNLAFNASEPARAIAGATLAGQALRSLNATLQRPASSPRVEVQFGAYATFSSFFGLAGLHELGADFTGIVDYASSMSFELVTNASVPAAAGGAAVSPDDVSVRFRFANGSASARSPPQAYPLFGPGESLMPWSAFRSNMERIAVMDTARWCEVCGPASSGCAAGAVGAASGGSDGTITKAVAGAIGALVTLGLVLVTGGLFMGVGGLRLVKKRDLVPAPASDKMSV
ncbi:hypothetical protein PpBr36_03510 [Pyricularia pennisetigena]|uniref:hypothetical protein n=1 Tax=Pyricularia pennisetigena TaxID=1578925 RepID=UPI00114E8565|nr:hypothetical protein PpBr36_03510 [Pyricularia pennisetigena]TLS30817.1 hypothetical protein PpBr36_03510 [Pyricularia pennisetigena]